MRRMTIEAVQGWGPPGSAGLMRQQPTEIESLNDSKREHLSECKESGRGKTIAVAKVRESEMRFKTKGYLLLGLS